MKPTKQQLVIIKRRFEEQTIRWRRATSPTLPYFLVAWHWFNQILNTVVADRVYYFIAYIWDQLQTWVNSRENWLLLRPNEQYQLVKWAQNLVRPHKITNFKEDWRDGIILCALIEGLAPGVCPHHDLLHPKQAILNLELGLRLAETHLGIASYLTALDILNMEKGMDKKLEEFVARLRSRSQVHLNSVCRLTAGKSQSCISEEAMRIPPTCFAKGMGLLVGNKGQKACFNIYLHTNEFMNIVIEIVGPEGDYCSERITLQSPRKKEFFDGSFQSGTLGKDFRQSLKSGRTINIFLEYEMFSKKIAVTYIPPSTGHYQLAIISRGQHIFGSPFTVVVDKENIVPYHRYMSISLPRQESEVNLLDSSTVNMSIVKHMLLFEGKTKRRLIRSIVFRHYANIVLEPGEPLPNDPRAWEADASTSIHESSIDDCETEEWSQPASITNTENACMVQGNETLSKDAELNCQHQPDANHQKETDDAGTDFYEGEMSTSREDSLSDAETDTQTVDILDERQQIDTVLQEMDYETPINLPDEKHAATNEVYDIAITGNYNRQDSCEKSSSNFPSSNSSPFGPVNGNLKNLIAKMKRKLTNELNVEITNLRASNMGNEPNTGNSAVNMREKWRIPVITCNGIFCQHSSKAGSSYINGGASSSRVSKTLINDTDPLWNLEGEGIVTTRLKEYEHQIRTHGGTGNSLACTSRTSNVYRSLPGLGNHPVNQTTTATDNDLQKSNNIPLKATNTKWKSSESLFCNEAPSSGNF